MTLKERKEYNRLVTTLANKSHMSQKSIVRINELGKKSVEFRKKKKITTPEWLI